MRLVMFHAVNTDEISPGVFSIRCACRVDDTIVVFNSSNNARDLYAEMVAAGMPPLGEAAYQTAARNLVATLALGPRFAVVRYLHRGGSE